MRDMRPFSRRVCIALTSFALLGGMGALGRAQDAPPVAEAEAPPAPAPEAPYESRLIRLSQVLGSVDYLRKLCNKDGGEEWRAKMKALLDTEAAGEPERIRRLTAAFNRGYRSFASVYTTCTESAVAAEQQYRREGATLAREIVAKYGN
jgi:uncharacterized protein (TIGR02301 family)